MERLSALQRKWRREAFDLKSEFIKNMNDGWSLSLAAKMAGVNWSTHRRFLLEHQDALEVVRNYKTELMKRKALSL